MTSHSYSFPASSLCLSPECPRTAEALIYPQTFRPRGKGRAEREGEREDTLFGGEGGLAVNLQD